MSADMDPHTVASPPAMTALRDLAGWERAWPDKDRGLVFECRDSSGHLRAGRINAAGQVDTLPYAQDPALPDLSTRLVAPHAEGRLVVHRAGRRAVVMGTDRVHKLVRVGRAERLADPRAAGPFLRAGLRTAEVLARSESSVHLELLPGRSLHELSDAGLAGWERLTQLWPGVIRPESLPEHTGADEAAVMQRWHRRALRLGAIDTIGAQDELRPALSAAIDTVSALLRKPGDPPAASHRDLHDGQLLWDGTVLSLLDLDTAALAEPALDLGNLAAHVDLARAQGRLGAQAHTHVGRLLDDLAQDLASVPRLSAYYLASRLRLSFVHAFRPGAQQWLPAWTDESLHLAASPDRAWAARIREG
ncbi:phosphotransferase family protein [Actinomyces qiguomingii]|uniref:phosphotransferase family protein n=1 Tax=Actinomyces qiguomingii TaxID=2057800 RepID=UPI000CA08548|nr:serine kinase [Actinomyces qiguomingii]